MVTASDEAMRASRRRFLAGAAAGARFGGILSAAGTEGRAATLPAALPFWGAHQGGIVTPPQSFTCFAAFDLLASTRDGVAMLLRSWTDAAARLTADRTHPLTATKPAAPPGGGSSQEPDPGAPAADSGEADGLEPARLTLTFGFGAGVFEKDGDDRYGLRTRRPEAFVDYRDLPATGWRLSAPAAMFRCRLARTIRRSRSTRCANSPAWARTGCGCVGSERIPAAHRHRRDTTQPDGFQGRYQQSANAGPRGHAPFRLGGWRGAGLDARRQLCRRTPHRYRAAALGPQRSAAEEQAVGRQKRSGAPLGRQHEFDPIDLDATDPGGNPVVPENSTCGWRTPRPTAMRQSFRRPYSYNDGLLPAEHRRRDMEYDAGLFFICYQRDPRTGFIRIYERMSQRDMLNRFVSHVGGGMFACPAARRRASTSASIVRRRLNDALRYYFEHGSVLGPTVDRALAVMHEAALRHRAVAGIGEGMQHSEFS